MITNEGLDSLAKEIMAHGFDEKTACRFAGLIGDVPWPDAHGNLIVRDERGHELARIPWPKMFPRR